MVTQIDQEGRQYERANQDKENEFPATIWI